VFLIYQEPGKDNYTEVQMTKSPKGWYVGKIPKKAVVGKSIRYYFEGRNAAGKTIVTNGEEAKPLVVLLMTEEAYRKSKEKGVDRSGPDKENPLNVPEGPDRFGNRKWWIGIGAGTGFGYAKGDGLEAVNRSPDQSLNSLRGDFVAGGAWAGYGNFVPEVGFQLSPNIALSAAVRWQMIYSPEKYRRFTASGAVSGMAKLMLYTKQSQVRLFGTVLAGGGEGFRFVVKPAATVTCPGDDLCEIRDFQDTVRAGPFIAGVGGGLYYEASKRVSVVLEAHAIAGMPTFGLLVDGTLALQFNFYKSTVDTTPPGRYVPKEEVEEPK
jgi:hypothetical protein